ncbi:MAG TPA: polyphosphate kinase 2 family protein, partial [Acidimicrobiia bacterium]
MAIDLAHLQVASGHSPRLARRDPADRLGLTGKTAAREQRDALLDELEELHGRLWAEAKRSVLLVLQGVDTSGKDGVIRRALSGLNPQGCSVTS